VKKELAFIDHYDSFSFNVIDWLQRGGTSVRYVAFDDHATLAQIANERLPLVFSPGPKSPDEALSSLQLLQNSLGKVPLLGICLGHQMLAKVAGGKIEKAKNPFHGATRQIHVSARSHKLFQNIPPCFRAATYNSLTVVPDSGNFDVLALCEQGDVQALCWNGKGAPAVSVQFHPESFMSDAGSMQQLCENWLQMIVYPFHSALRHSVHLNRNL
jgi:anthranilate synthase/aminodeoxychorismate synthase-like glutamine amidotransferase